MRPNNGITDNEDAILELAEMVSELSERIEILEGEKNDGE